jgi:hypothetical protein
MCPTHPFARLWGLKPFQQAQRQVATSVGSSHLGLLPSALQLPRFHRERDFRSHPLPQNKKRQEKATSIESDS